MSRHFLRAAMGCRPSKDPGCYRSRPPPSSAFWGRFRPERDGGPSAGLPPCRATVLPLRRGAAAGPPSDAPGATGRTGWPNWQGRCGLRDHKMPGRADCVTMRLPAGGIWTRPDTRPPLYRRNASCACRTYGRRICGSGRGRRRGGNPGTAFRGRCGADGDAPDH